MLQNLQYTNNEQEAYRAIISTAIKQFVLFL